MSVKKKNSYPGYPHYPASEDVTRAANNNGIVPLNEQPNGLKNGTDHQSDSGKKHITTDSDADVTSDDLQLLDAADLMDSGDSSNQRQAEVDQTDDDGDPLNEDMELDVPGSEMDDDNEALGEEDEENNYYSLGGDNHESQEERKGD